MQKRIQKETGNNCVKRIIVAFLAVIMMTTMLHPQMVQAATGTENGIYQTPDAGGYSNGEAAYSGGAGGSTDGDAASGMVLFRV